jgi:hypothetical protein
VRVLLWDYRANVADVIGFTEGENE